MVAHCTAPEFAAYVTESRGCRPRTVAASIDYRAVVKEPAETPAPPTGFDEVERLIDGGGMDCGSGLLLLITRGMRRLNGGELLGIRSAEPSVVVDLPVWAELVGHELAPGGRGDP